MTDLEIAYATVDDMQGVIDRLAADNKAKDELIDHLRGVNHGDNAIAIIEELESELVRVKADNKNLVRRVELIKANRNRYFDKTVEFGKEIHDIRNKWHIDLNDKKKLADELATYKAGNVPVTQIISDNEALALENENLKSDKKKLVDELKEIKLQYSHDDTKNTEQVLHRWIIVKGENQVPYVVKPLKNSCQGVIDMLLEIKRCFPTAETVTAELVYGGQLWVNSGKEILAINQSIKADGA